MNSRAGRTLSLALVFSAGAALFLGSASPAQAGDRPARAPLARPAPPNLLLPVSTTPTTSVRTAHTRIAIPEAQRPMTALQIAARHGLKYHDAGTYVLLEGGTLRVRIYPGTSTVVIAGREYTVKDPALRSERTIVLSKRVTGFLNHKIGSFRADERVHKTVHRGRPRARPRFKPLPPLPPKPKRAKRTPAPARTIPAKPAPKKIAPIGPERQWIPPTRERKWKWIVIHHSDDQRGNMAKYDDYHRNDKGWEHGCGYHFVIGNGSLSGNGEVEMGPRWTKQLHGAHAKTPDNRFNDHGVGICLVGDFNVGSAKPSSAQMSALVRLVRWLRDRYGINLSDVHGHCDCCSTECPGKNFPWAELKRRAR